MNRLRVASAQYFIRPVQRIEQFEEQVEALVDTAADYDCKLVLLPEYFTIQLLTLGNVKQQPFSQTWTRNDHAVVNTLRSPDRPLSGRCAECRFREICGGGFRVRAWQNSGDPWAEDPGCYLTAQETAGN